MLACSILRLIFCRRPRTTVIRIPTCINGHRFALSWLLNRSTIRGQHNSLSKILRKNRVRSCVPSLFYSSMDSCFHSLLYGIPCYVLVSSYALRLSISYVTHFLLLTNFYRLTMLFTSSRALRRFTLLKTN